MAEVTESKKAGDAVLMPEKPTVISSRARDRQGCRVVEVYRNHIAGREALRTPMAHNRTLSRCLCYDNSAATEKKASCCSGALGRNWSRVSYLYVCDQVRCPEILYRAISTASCYPALQKVLLLSLHFPTLTLPKIQSLTSAIRNHITRTGLTTLPSLRSCKALEKSSNL